MDSASYDSICLVVELWDQVRYGADDFDAEFGQLIMTKLFELDPLAKVAFAMSDDETRAAFQARLRQYGADVTRVFDSVFQTLGPDLEFMQNVIQEAGLDVHHVLGIPIDIFPSLGEALQCGMERFLGREFRRDEQQAWRDVYDGISTEMIKGYHAPTTVVVFQPKHSYKRRVGF